MRIISVYEVREAVESLCGSTNLNLPDSLVKKLEAAKSEEKSPLCADVLASCLENVGTAKRLHIPVCQDTGMAVIFLDIGQEVHFKGGDLYETVNAGVAAGYNKAGLRMSIVSDPLRRINTGNNTPAVIHTNIVSGDGVEITLVPKGFGSENMSRLTMLLPSAGRKEVIDFVAETVRLAGSNPCPPVIIGVGLGGSFEYSAYLSKKALCREAGEPNPDRFYAELERDILTNVNALGIGAQGFGGTVTALAAHVETFPTHIAGLPAAVNISCHVSRHGKIKI